MRHLVRSLPLRALLALSSAFAFACGGDGGADPADVDAADPGVDAASSSTTDAGRADRAAPASASGDAGGGSSSPDAATSRADGGAPRDGAATSPNTDGAVAPAASAWVFVSGYNANVLTLKLDLTAGTLQNVSMATAGTNASYLAWSPDKKYLYALNENGANGRIYAFGIDAATGALTAVNNVPTPAGTNGTPHISVHPGGKWIFLAFYNSGHVTVHPVMPNGAVGEATDVQAPAATGCVNAHQAYSDSKGEFLFVPCKGSNFVLQFKFDEKTGKLSPNDPAKVATAAGSGPRHMDIHPNRKWAYVINENDDTMVAFDYDLAKGLLSNPAVVLRLPAGVNGAMNSTAHVVVHPNGKFVYGSNRGHNSIVIYAVDQATGRLTLVGHELGDMAGRGKINVPRDFTIDPTGAYLLVANQRTDGMPTVGDSVIVFRIDATTGKLTKTGVLEAPINPTFVGVLPR